jgi:tRNA pseudouridine38-40 synthase
VSNPHDDNEPAAPLGDGGLAAPAGPAGRQRLRLDLAYDGTDFSGWARQPGRRTVQQVLEEAFATVLRVPKPPRLTVAGRTDAGVHALGQVAHVDVTDLSDSLTQLGRRLAGVLPPDLAVRAIRIVPSDFDARFSALGRHYAYRVNDGVANPLRRRDTLRWPRRLDPERMHEAARALVGHHDFGSYCKPRVGATTIRTLHQLDVARDTESIVVLTAHADAFCHHQVRSMVGALIAVGEGRRSKTWPAEVLGAGVRDSLVNVAASLGLTLTKVDYPSDEDLGARAELTRQRRANRS